MSKSDRTPWQPSSSSVVCSEHFVDGIPTELNPLPTLKLGYNVSQQIGQVPMVRIQNRSQLLHTPATIIPPPVAEHAAVQDILVNRNPKTNHDRTTIPEVGYGECPTTQDRVESNPMDSFGSYSDLEIKPKALIVHPATATRDEVEIETQASVRAAAITRKKLTALQGKCMSQSMLLKAKTKQLQRHNLPLHKKLLQKDQDVVFYTAIPNKEIFYMICNYYREFLPKTQNKKVGLSQIKLKYRKFQPMKVFIQLSVEDRVLLVLMRLRLGLLRKDLADR